MPLDVLSSANLIMYAADVCGQHDNGFKLYSVAPAYACLSISIEFILAASDCIGLKL